VIDFDVLLGSIGAEQKAGELEARRLRPVVALDGQQARDGVEGLQRALDEFNLALKLNASMQDRHIHLFNRGRVETLLKQYEPALTEHGFSAEEIRTLEREGVFG
jgi:hypothetical protein